MAGVVREVASWIETANAAAGAASATRAAPPGGLRHFITSISASFSSPETTGALLTLEEGTSTEIGRWYVYDNFTITFPSPIQITPGDSVHADLAAGTGTGAVNLTGYTL